MTTIEQEKEIFHLMSELQAKGKVKKYTSLLLPCGNNLITKNMSVGISNKHGMFIHIFIKGGGNIASFESYMSPGSLCLNSAECVGIRKFAKGTYVQEDLFDICDTSDEYTFQLLTLYDHNTVAGIVLNSLFNEERYQHVIRYHRSYGDNTSDVDYGAVIDSLKQVLEGTWGY